MTDPCLTVGAHLWPWNDPRFIYDPPPTITTDRVLIEHAGYVQSTPAPIGTRTIRVELSEDDLRRLIGAPEAAKVENVHGVIAITWKEGNDATK